MKLPERINNEAKFAKAYRDRYIMANNRNKEFVKVPILNIKELEEHYDVHKILTELIKLGFSKIGQVNHDHFLIAIRDTETREIKLGRVFTIYQFAHLNWP